MPFLEQLGPGVRDAVAAWRELPLEALAREENRFLVPGAGGLREIARFEPHGTLVLADPRFPLWGGGRPRRLATFDAGGRLLSWFRWNGAGELKRFGLELPGKLSIGLVAGVEEHGQWGVSDAVALLGQNNAPTRTLCRAARSDFARLTHIPPLDEPGALPPGAGAALMNVFAELMQDQGVEAARYRGPYPTEALLESLLESFEPLPAEGSGLERGAGLAVFAAQFTRGVEEQALKGELVTSPVAFRPHPHERRLLGDSAAVHIRSGQVERFVCDGVSYTTPVVGGFVRQGARVLHDGSDGWLRASLVILGEPVEHHYMVAVNGLEYAVNDRELPPIEPEPVSPLWPKALKVLMAHQMTRLLVPAALEIMDTLEFFWGSTGRAAASLQGQKMFLHPAFRFVFRARRDKAGTGEEKTWLAKALATEVLMAVSQPVRQRAQRALERISPVEQRSYIKYAMEDFDVQGFVQANGRDVAELVAALVKAE